MADTTASSQATNGAKTAQESNGAVAALVDEACGALAAAGLLTVTLEHLARFSISRRS